MPDYSIILLPRQDYWDWVQAARDYVVKFGANLTPDPDSAARYMTPQQIVTIAGLPNGYPAQGDIQAWFRKNYPSLRTDYVPAASPAEFHRILQERIAANDRFGLAGKEFKLLWPTEFPVVTQSFGANPEIYRRWGLPGHEGIDFRAARNTKVFACADGTAARVDVYRGDPTQQPYGHSVRLQHRDGYLTVYAHLERALVKVGQVVKAGDVIGLADATGNSSGHHLHLMLKKAGATAAGLTNYPNDIVDPTPFLVWPAEATTLEEQLPDSSYPWPPGVCLVGVHGRADGRLQEADFTVVRQSRAEAVKLLSSAAPEDVDRLRSLNPNIFILVRLFAAFHGRNYNADQFATDLTHDMGQFYRRGVRYFEIHNEPNLVTEGWTTSWQNGRDFGAWFLRVRERLKQTYPEAKLGYPGLSPDGVPAPGLRTNDLAFLSESDEAARAADWIGVHCYWLSEDEMNSPAGGKGYLEIRRHHPDKLLFITEFSNPAQGVDRRTKGQQYVRYYQNVRNVPGVGAAFCFVLSASASFPWEAWRDEDGSVSEIPALVGARAI
jgi:murein DD-endopeptidase MepM/ murein hydrolase activator NlpD